MRVEVPFEEAREVGASEREERAASPSSSGSGSTGGAKLKKKLKNSLTALSQSDTHEARARKWKTASL